MWKSSLSIFFISPKFFCSLPNLLLLGKTKIDNSHHMYFFSNSFDSCENHTQTGKILKSFKRNLVSVKIHQRYLIFCFADLIGKKSYGGLNFPEFSKKTLLSLFCKVVSCKFVLVFSFSFLSVLFAFDISISHQFWNYLIQVLIVHF